jgi:hypothetical protein
MKTNSENASSKSVIIPSAFQNTVAQDTGNKNFSLFFYMVVKHGFLFLREERKVSRAGLTMKWAIYSITYKELSDL